MQTNPFAEKNRKPPFLKVIDESVGHTQVENDFFKPDKEENPLDSLLKKAGLDPTRSKEKDPTRDQDDPFMSSFLVELIHSIKSKLASIQTTASLSADRLNNGEFKKAAQRSIAEDIKEIDSVLNSLLNYIHINTPIIKSNTISIILEEVLEANKKQIEDKKIRLFKKCEKDLSETFVHDEQLRFILNSALQFAILSTPPEGRIGFLIKSFDFRNGVPDKKVPPEKNGGYIEAAIGFTGGKDPFEPSRDISAKLGDRKEEPSRLILQLIREILLKNHGSMAYEVHPKKPRALITLRVPMERRKVVYYEPITI